MLKQSGLRMKFRVAFCFLGIFFVATLGMFGCAATETTRQPDDQTTTTTEQAAAPEEKLITDISIEERADAIVVSITANHVVDYTLAEPPLQQAKVLYFPDAALDLPANDYSSDNEVIGAIQALELVKGGPSKVVIPIKSPGVACEASRTGDDTILQVVFPRIAGAQPAAAEILTEDIVAEEGAQTAEASVAEEEVQPEEAAVAEKEEVQPEEEYAAQDEPLSVATRLETIEVTEDAGRVSVKIKADGAVTEYKSFTLTGPPRIVLDLAGLASSHKKEQRLDVDSDMVHKIRHFAHPDYLRVVLDVDELYLSDFKATSVDDGLIVQVGDAKQAVALPPTEQEEELALAEDAYMEPTEAPEEAISDLPAVEAEAEEEWVEAEEEAEPAVAADSGMEEITETGPTAEVAVSETEEESVVIKKHERPALVNHIDFIDDQGRSTVRIGTTHPVKFDLAKTGENKLRLTLDDADILSFRQRPLITTRFESAINSIIPLQTQAMKEKGMSVVDINLREEVGYYTERAGNLILVHFETSSVAPEPAEKVVIPTEYEVLSKAAEAASAPEEVVAKEVPAEGLAEETPAEGMAAEVVEEEATTTAPAIAAGAEEAAPAPIEAESAVAEEEAESVVPPADESSPSFRKKKVYTGEPIALDFYKTDIRNVIRILKDVSGKNFAIDKDVSGSVTLSFINPVPWDQVLDLILEMNDLGMMERDGIIRIATKETIRRQKESAQAELAAEQDLRTTEEQLAPLVTEYFAISYSDAATDILPHITDILTPERGHAKVDTRTNQVIMTDIPEKIEMAREIIEKIDRVTPQVMIKARIIETTTDFSREFGTEWGISNTPGGTYNRDLGGTYTYDVAMNNPAASATNVLGFNFSRIVGTPFSLDAKLSLMETHDQIRIVSSPRIVTLDNKEAFISQGQEIPYTVVEDEETDTEFKDAKLELRVTPHVTPDNRISMKIQIIQDEVGAMGVYEEPPIDTKEATTELLVNDGDTIVIGGIIQETDKKTISGLPYISKIPLLGFLFQQQSRSKEKIELLIFMTPIIVRLD